VPRIPSITSSVRLLALGAALLLAAAACTTPSTGQIGGTVRVLGSWEGAEEDAFMAMVRPFEQQTGVTVRYTGSRDLNGLLWEGVAKRNTPDVAGLPGPGQMAEFARHGALKDLTSVIDVARYKAETVPAFVELGTVDGRLVGVFIKASLKGLVWYNPRMYTLGAPRDWSDLVEKAELARRTGTATWCLALESGATSGWPGTDWIEDIVLRQSGPAVYDDWVAGRLPWSSPEIRAAFELFATVVDDAYGGRTSEIAQNFMDGGNGLFTDPPGCLFHHQATFMTEFFKSRAGAREGEYDFFPFPDINATYANSVIGGGDLFGMFNDTPQARALMAYLVTPEAQSIWVRRGGALSVNVRVVDYPDDIQRKAADVLTGAERFRFDASDLMPEQMNSAFLQGVLDFVRNPDDLDDILVRLDDVQRRLNSGDSFQGP
jgi:alpha-glucoside transport system substrate-binding protein